MRAATIRDGQIRIEEHPDPEPGVGEVLVGVRAAGLNGADIHQLGGRYPAPPGSPQDIPGLELAGEVLARGPGVMRFEEGARVMGVNRSAGPPASPARFAHASRRARVGSGAADEPRAAVLRARLVGCRCAGIASARFRSPAPE